MPGVYDQFKSGSGAFAQAQAPTPVAKPPKEGIFKRIGRSLLPKAIEEKIIGPKPVAVIPLGVERFKAKQGVFAPETAPQADVIPETTPTPPSGEKGLYGQYRQGTGAFSRTPLLADQVRPPATDVLAREDVEKTVQLEDRPKGTPEQESKFKDVWDAFYLGARSLFHKSKQYFTSAVPEMLFRDIPEDPTKRSPGERRISLEKVKEINEVHQERRARFREKYLKGEEKHQQWLKDHPELQPRKEYEGPVLEKIKENPKLLLDPGYVGTIMAESASFALAFLGTATAVTVATGGNIPLGIAAGVAVTIPATSQDLYEDLINSGATPDQAQELTKFIGPVIASIEVVGGYPLLKAVSPLFSQTLKRQIQKELAKKTVATLIKEGLKTFTVIEVNEVLEEVIQGAIQDATVKTFDENRKVLENIPETVIRTAISTIPFALFGGASVIRQQARVTPPGGIPPEPAAPVVPEEVEPPITEEVVPEIPKELEALAKKAEAVIKKGGTAEDFEIDLAKEFTLGKPKKIPIEVPEVGSIIITKLTDAKYEVVEAIENRLRVRRIGTKNVITIGADEVTKIVKGEMVPIKIILAPSETQIEAIRIKNQEALRNSGFDSLTDFFNQVKRVRPPTAKPIPTEITAKDLVESRTIEEINEKLDKVFGTLEELEVIDEKLLQDFNSLGSYAELKESETDFEEVTGVSEADYKKLDLANQYRADIERSANDRDLEETKDLLSRVMFDIVPAKIDELTRDFRTEYNKHPEAQEKLTNILEEINASEPGSRFSYTPDDTDRVVVGVPSTFPSWLPEELRSRDLFNKTLSNLVDIGSIKYPAGNRTRQRALYDAILDELDSELNISTRETRNAIMDVYEAREEVTTPEEIEGRITREKERREGEVKPEEIFKGEELAFKPNNLRDPSKPKAREEVGKIVKRSEIASTISEKFNLPIRRGRFRSRGAIAIFKPDLKLIRFKGGGLPTIFHETGHFIDDKFGFKQYFLGRGVNITERKALVQEYGDGNVYAGNPSKQAGEAFAEFVRFYYTERNKAQKLAPRFFTIYEKRMEELPEIRDVMDTAALDYKRWLDMPSASKVLSQISFENKDTRSLKDKAIDKAHRLYEMGVDNLHPLSEYTKLAKRLGVALEDKNNPYVLARLIRGWHGKADTFLEKGTFKRKFWDIKDGKTELKLTGKSFKEIVKPIEEKGALQDLSIYLVSKRAVELSDRKIKTGINKSDAEQAIRDIVEEHKDIDFEKVAEELYEYQNAVLNYGMESGLIEQSAIVEMRKLNRFYVPFFRVMEELQTRGYMGRGFGNVTKATKKIRGSDREIIDPLESIVKNTYAIISASERNAVAMSMMSLSEKNFELGRMFEKLPKPLAPVKINVGEVMEAAFGKLGTMMLPPELQAEFDNKMVTLFKPAFFSPKGEVTVLIAGRPQSFKVDPEIYRAMQSLDQEEIAMVVKILSYPAKFLRAGATLAPEFMVRNPARDQMTAYVFSKFGYVPVVDLARGTYGLLARDTDYWLWRMGGGEHAMLVSLDRESMKKNLDEVLASRGMRGLKYIKNPLKAMQILSSLGEAGTRIGEAKKALKKGADPIEAAFAAREVTLDFARIGSKTKAVNMLIAFWNANIQGLDKMNRAFKERPYATTLKAIMGLTLPSILLYFANRDDPRWKEIPQWQKDLFWIIFTEDHIWRIPKPFVLGQIFGSVPERILEYIDNDNPEIFESLFKSIRDGAMPGLIPTFLLPWIENAANYSFFLDRKLVSDSKEDLPPEAQFTNYTSEFSKEIGKWLEVSPIKIDNLIRGYFAGLGTYAIKGVDKALEGLDIVNPVPKPEKRIEDLPLIKAFMIREPIGGGSESINQFYEKANEAAASFSHYNQLLQIGRVEEAREVLVDHPELKLSTSYQVVRVQLSAIFKAKDAIMKSGKISPEEKRRRVDKLDRLATDIAAKAMTMKLKKTEGEKKEEKE